MVKRVVASVPDVLLTRNSRHNTNVFKSFDKLTPFISATSLVIRWQSSAEGSSSHLQSNPAGIQDTVASFARIFRRLVPTATHVVVTFDGRVPKDCPYKQVCTTLVEELCHNKGVYRLEALSTNSKRILLGSLLITGLTSITQTVCTGCAPFAMFAYRNAATLRELRIRIAEETSWQALVFGGTMTSAVYSKLSVLSLCLVNVKPEVTWEGIQLVAPLTSLSTLEILQAYPFEDDILFRGNSATLKTLAILFWMLTGTSFEWHCLPNRSSAMPVTSVHVHSRYEPGKKSAPWVDNGVIASQVHCTLGVTTTLVVKKDSLAVLVQGYLLCAGLCDSPALEL
ncbi:hypothetical protein GGI21_005206 [Coemansia aciculifera]|nr:hypothetical protein GGI21_005206 [Coemansia aciculifera]